MTQTANYLKRNPEIAGLAAILVLSAILRLVFLHEPFERDEGQYATIAQTILRGGFPYRDAIEIKPPGTFYLYALAIGVFGASTEAVRLFTALYALCTVVAVYGVARQIAGARAGLWAALVYGVFSSFPKLQGSSSNTEVFLVLPLMTGIWFLLQARGEKRRLLLACCGLCGALAMLIKQVALPVIALEFLLIPFLKYDKERFKACAIDLAAFVLPMALCALAVLGYFSLQGVLDDFLYWTVEFPRSYKGSGALGPSLGFTLNLLASALVLPALLGIPSALWLAATRRDATGWLPLLMTAAACLAIALPGKYFPHYFILLVPFLAVPAGIGLERVLRLPAGKAFLTLALPVLALGFAVWDNYKFYTVYSPQEVSENKYGTTLFVDSLAVAGYLREQTRPGDYIFQWGFEPELYFLADRRPPNPFLVSLIPAWSRDPAAASRQLMQSLIETRPAFIVLQEEWANLPGIEEVSQYIGKNCTADRRIGYALIYRCSQNVPR